MPGTSNRVMARTISIRGKAAPLGLALTVAHCLLMPAACRESVRQAPSPLAPETAHWRQPQSTDDAAERVFCARVRSVGMRNASHACMPMKLTSVHTRLTRWVVELEITEPDPYGVYKSAEVTRFLVHSPIILFRPALTPKDHSYIGKQFQFREKREEGSPIYHLHVVPQQGARPANPASDTLPMNESKDAHGTSAGAERVRTQGQHCRIVAFCNYVERLAGRWWW